MSIAYDSTNKSAFALDECEAAVGKRASLTLTGEIIGARESDAGSFVRFKVDPRWGLELTIGMDLDAFVLEET